MATRRRRPSQAGADPGIHPRPVAEDLGEEEPPRLSAAPRACRQAARTQRRSPAPIVLSAFPPHPGPYYSRRHSRTCQRRPRRLPARRTLPRRQLRSGVMTRPRPSNGLPSRGVPGQRAGAVGIEADVDDLAVVDRGHLLELVRRGRPRHFSAAAHRRPGRSTITFEWRPYGAGGDGGSPAGPMKAKTWSVPGSRSRPSATEGVGKWFACPPNGIDTTS